MPDSFFDEVKDIMGKNEPVETPEPITPEPVATQQQEPSQAPSALPQQDVIPEKPFDWSQFGDGISSSDDVIQRMRSLNDELGSIKTELAAVKTAVIDDPELARLASLKKTDEEKYKFFSGIVLGGADIPAMEVVRRDIISKNPEWASQPDVVEEYINETYGLNVDVPSPLPEGEDDPDTIAEYNRAREKAEKKIKVGRMRLQSAAKEVKERWMSEFNSIPYTPPQPPKSKEVEEAEMYSRKKEWAPIATELVTKLKGFPVYIPSPETGKEVELTSIEFSEDEKLLLSDFISGWAAATNQVKDKSVVPTLVSVALGEFARRNQQKIYSAIISAARSLSEEELKKYHTDATIITGSGSPVTTEPSARHQASVQAVVASMGG